MYELTVAFPPPVLQPPISVRKDNTLLPIEGRGEHQNHLHIPSNRNPGELHACLGKARRDCVNRAAAADFLPAYIVSQSKMRQDFIASRAWMKYAGYVTRLRRACWWDEIVAQGISGMLVRGVSQGSMTDGCNSRRSRVTSRSVGSLREATTEPRH